jgi:hypothetical protein
MEETPQEMEETKSHATRNGRDEITRHKNGRQRNGMEDNEMEWKTRPMLGTQRIYL